MDTFLPPQRSAVSADDVFPELKGVKPFSAPKRYNGLSPAAQCLILGPDGGNKNTIPNDTRVTDTGSDRVTDTGAYRIYQ